LTEKHAAPIADDQDGWFKSSYSSGAASCIEIKLSADVILMRDSKDPRLGRPVISLTKSEWSSFMATVRASPLSRDATTDG
jgi:hypothetical protein